MVNPYTDESEIRRSYHSGLQPRHTAQFDYLEQVQAYQARLKTDADLGELPEHVVAFKTTRYVGRGFRVTCRTSKNDWQDIEGEVLEDEWRFSIPPEHFASGFAMKLVLHHDAWSEKGFFWMRGNDVQVPAGSTKCLLDDGAVRFTYNIRLTGTKYRPSHLITLRTDMDGWGRDLFGRYDRHNGGRWTFELDCHLYIENFLARFVLDQAHLNSDGAFEITSEQADYERSDDAISFDVEPDAFQHHYGNFTTIVHRLEQETVYPCGRHDHEYDVIVIGSGMGGGTLADALSDAEVKVLLLEAGGLRFPVHFNELPRHEVSWVSRDQLDHFDNEEHSSLNPGVHFNLGGRSVYWSGLIPRMQQWEFDQDWPHAVRNDLLTGSGDASGYDEAEKLMRKQKSLGPYQSDVIEHFQRTIGDDFDAILLPRSMHQPDIDEDNRPANVIERSTGGFSTADLLLDSLGFSGTPGRDYLGVNLHHLATRIETEGNRATAVVCQDLAGREPRRYRAKYIVLACGSVESPRLALCSQLVDPNNKIGRGLTDHPAYFYNRLLELPTEGPLAWLGDSKGHSKVLLRHKNGDPAEHPYNIELLINARYWDTRHADDDLWRERILSDDPARVEIKFIFNSRLNDCNRIRLKEDGRPTVRVARNETGVPFKKEIARVRNIILRALEAKGSDSLEDCYLEGEWREGVHGSVHHSVSGGSVEHRDDRAALRWGAGRLWRRVCVWRKGVRGGIVSRHCHPAYGCRSSVGWGGGWGDRRISEG